MNQVIISNSSQEEWLRVLGKGMITLPKKWRDDLGIVEGDMIKAKKQGSKVLIEPVQEYAPLRIYTDSQIDRFVKDDSLSPVLAKKLKMKFKKLLKSK